MDCPVCGRPALFLKQYAPGKQRCGDCERTMTVSVARVPCQDGRRANGRNNKQRYTITRAELARRGILVL